ncbi:MAG TPA: NAD(P)/FAD-dependent oxidoreductase [Anaeromyxobacter sp.]|nr:NAD(P)/FAD-dependent oxidoreductase [Anaeromyxobacter sp.]
MRQPTDDAPVVVAGAGPAGLAAALALARAGRAVVVVEREAEIGGLARTIERDGYRFDLGGHRFFTSVPEVRALWDDLLGEDMWVRRRRSRILFHGRFFDYPITIQSALRGLGALESARIVASYLRAKLRPVRPETTLADWLVNRFGRRLFETFFRPYTEKVWGRRCETIGAQWAAQRIRGLSLRAAVADALRRGSGGQRTLITEFRYPRRGPGMLWDRMRERIVELGQRVLTAHAVVALRHRDGAVQEVEVEAPSGRLVLPCSHVVSTLPLRDLVRALDPAPPLEVLDAAASLRHRDFLVVALVLDGAEPFPDTWLYLHDPGVRAGRVQNFRAWSPELVPDPSRCCLGMEYFCSAGDDVWARSDAALVELALADLDALGFGGRGRLVAGHVVRVREAYPVYDAGFVRRLEVVRRGLGTLSNLQVAGRNGMHRYNNMDHSMLTGLLAARNVLGERLDLWHVNADEAYLEPS